MYIVQITQNNEVANLACSTLSEAIMVKQSFVNYGLCSDVKIIVKGE